MCKSADINPERAFKAAIIVNIDLPDDVETFEDAVMSVVQHCGISVDNNCEKCQTSCIEQVRFAKPFKEIWHSENADAAKVRMDIFDKVERHENCTVEIRANTATGKVSVVWWENKSR